MADARNGGQALKKKAPYEQSKPAFQSDLHNSGAHTADGGLKLSCDFCNFHGRLGPSPPYRLAAVQCYVTWLLLLLLLL